MVCLFFFFFVFVSSFLFCIFGRDCMVVLWFAAALVVNAWIHGYSFQLECPHKLDMAIFTISSSFSLVGFSLCYIIAIQLAFPPWRTTLVRFVHTRISKACAFSKSHSLFFLFEKEEEYSDHEEEVESKLKLLPKKGQSFTRPHCNHIEERILCKL